MPLAGGHVLGYEPLADIFHICANGHLAWHATLENLSSQLLPLSLFYSPVALRLKDFKWILSTRGFPMEKRKEQLQVEYMDTAGLPDFLQLTKFMTCSVHF